MTKQFTELTDSQWAAISPFLNTTRQRKHNLRHIVNALFLILRTGMQWRNLPKSAPHWQTVYYYFDQWKKDEIFLKISLELTRRDRKRDGLAEEPEILSVDSQSVKLAPMIWEDRGLDPNKRVNGRKRQFLVDSGGRLWVIRVHAAARAAPQ